jgi:hypothetical protein
MNEEVEGTDMIALQLFAREFKQADLTLTGTARKANLVDQSTRTVPQTVPTQSNRRASAITAHTPTSARGRPSNAGLAVKEASDEPPAPKLDRKCIRCKVEASPRWWTTEDITELSQLAPCIVDGPLPKNELGPNGHAADDLKPVILNGHIVNGTTDLQMASAPPVASPTLRDHLRLNTEITVIKSDSYLCQKCHWKKQNGTDEEEERERSVSVLVETQQLPLRSPAVQPYGPPQPSAMAGSWGMPGGPPPLGTGQPPPLPSWHSAAPPAPVHPSHHHHNGMGHPPPPPPHATPVNHPPQYHAPYPPVNGYAPYPSVPMHAPMPPAPLRGSYHQGSGPPPPLQLTNGGMMVNGMHSPHTMPYSPTHHHTHVVSRSTESPYPAAQPAVPQYSTIHHESPMPGRPMTPRDTLMRDAPSVTSAPTERVNTGASASPSLRNLLH